MGQIERSQIMNSAVTSISAGLTSLVASLACVVGVLLSLVCVAGAFWLALKSKEGWGWFLFVGFLLGMAAIYNEPK